MRRLLVGFFLLLAFAAGCVAGAKNQAVSPARAGHEVIEQRWAYFCFQEGNPEQVSYKANAAGARGWEMVAAAPSDSGLPLWCFRQPRP
jgi:hypothetical protein